MADRKFLVSVIGGHKCDDPTRLLAEQIGQVAAQMQAVVVCGGLGGIMEAACRGAKKAGGLTVGIIPGEDKKEANRFVDIVIPTGMGYSRNALVAAAGDVIVALAGEYGTLSEISFALIQGKAVYGFESWDIPGVKKLESVDELKERLKKHKDELC